jgi:serine/threonine protein kinase
VMDLPKRLGPLTLMRHVSSQGLDNEYVAILDEPAGKRVLVRQVELHGTDSEEDRHALQVRLSHLQALQHPSLVSILCAHQEGHSFYIGEDRSDNISLRELITALAKKDKRLPQPVFLHIAMQACNALEALHRFKPKGSKDVVLHEALNPDAFFLDRAGNCRIGNYRLSAAGKSWTTSSVSIEAAQLAYLSPEQTSSRALQRSSDIFSFGVTLYELWALKHMFLASSTLQTLQRIRTGQVTANLTDVRESFHGLDRALYRALSLNPRHRYQQVLVLQEDLRALMAGFSFVNIEATTQEILAPIFDERETLVEAKASRGPELSTGSLLTRLVTEAKEEARAAATAKPIATPSQPPVPVSPPSDHLADYSDDEIALISLPPASMESFLGAANDPDTVSEPDSDDTAALLRDLSRRRDGEVEYAPAQQLQPVYDVEDDSTSAISIPPVPLQSPRSDETTPFDFDRTDSATEVLATAAPKLTLEEEDFDTTAAGVKGDTIPLPRPLSVPPAKSESAAGSEQTTDRGSPEARSARPDDTFSIYQPRSQMLPILILGAITVFVFCAGGLGTAAWLLTQAR